MLQTYLPYPNFAQTARVLDDVRLRKQRSDVSKILDALHWVSEDETPPFGTQAPVTKMWQGYEPQLCEYGLIMCEEWITRGHRDTFKTRIEHHMEAATASTYTMDAPPWLNDRELHRSHQSALVRISPLHYRRFFPGVPDNLPLVWPVK